MFFKNIGERVYIKIRFVLVIELFFTTVYIAACFINAIITFYTGCKIVISFDGIL